MTNATSRSRGTPVTATATGPTIYWRLGMSAWLLLLLVPGGALAWLGFGLLAIIARRRSWGVFAGVYAVAAIAVLVPEDPAGRIAAGTLYLVVLLHGLIINQSWLLLIWGRHENGLTIVGNPRGADARGGASGASRQRAAAIPKEAQKLLGTGGTSRSDYVDDSTPAPALPRRRLSRAQRRAQEATADRATARAAASAASAPSRSAPARAEPTRAEPTATAELIDVNTANQRTLARLTGMDRGLAKLAVAERTKRGGFASLEAFAATAGLQPHELVRLAAEAFCSARPRAARSFGRRVDY